MRYEYRHRSTRQNCQQLRLGCRRGHGDPHNRVNEWGLVWFGKARTCVRNNTLPGKTVRQISFSVLNRKRGGAFVLRQRIVGLLRLQVPTALVYIVAVDIMSTLDLPGLQWLPILSNT